MYKIILFETICKIGILVYEINIKYTKRIHFIVTDLIVLNTYLDNIILCRKRIYDIVEAISHIFYLIMYRMDHK